MPKTQKHGGSETPLVHVLLKIRSIFSSQGRYVFSFEANVDLLRTCTP